MDSESLSQPNGCWEKYFGECSRRGLFPPVSPCGWYSTQNIHNVFYNNVREKGYIAPLMFDILNENCNTYIS